MKSLKSESVVNNYGDMREMVLWHDRQSAIVLTRKGGDDCDYGICHSSKFELTSVSVQAKYTMRLRAPLVENAKEIREAEQAVALGLAVPIPEPKMESVASLPERMSLEEYEAEIKKWLKEERHWCYFKDRGVFTLHLEEFPPESDEDDAETMEEEWRKENPPLPRLVRIADQICESGLRLSLTEKQIRNLADLPKEVPGHIQSLCEGLLAAIEAAKATQERLEREYSENRRRDELAKKFGVKLP